MPQSDVFLIYMPAAGGNKKKCYLHPSATGADDSFEVRQGTDGAAAWKYEDKVDEFNNSQLGGKGIIETHSMTLTTVLMESKADEGSQFADRFVTSVLPPTKLTKHQIAKQMMAKIKSLESI
jgi:hypothetical protein